MTKTTPHPAFDLIRPDEVAECWEGVFDAGLYQPLWACVNSYTAPSPEESEEPCYGMDCVADFWDRFTPEQQLALNQLAERNDPVEQDSLDDEYLDLIPVRGQLEVKIDACGPVSHTVKAYYVPRDATEKAVKEAIGYWLPREFCQHEHDCCGRYYPNEGQLIARTYADDGQDVIFVLRTYTMNV